jgi:hypothetical protein
VLGLVRPVEVPDAGREIGGQPGLAVDGRVEPLRDRRDRKRRRIRVRPRNLPVGLVVRPVAEVVGVEPAPDLAFHRLCRLPAELSGAVLAWDLLRDHCSGEGESLAIGRVLQRRDLEGVDHGRTVRDPVVEVARIGRRIDLPDVEVVAERAEDIVVGEPPAIVARIADKAVPVPVLGHRPRPVEREHEVRGDGLDGDLPDRVVFLGRGRSQGPTHDEQRDLNRRREPVVPLPSNHLVLLNRIARLVNSSSRFARCWFRPR